MNDKPTCTHCGLPVPAGFVVPDAEHQFCCPGCHLAYDVIQGFGLQRYYDIRRRVDASTQPARSSGRSFGEFDDPTFLGLYGQTRPDGLATIDLYLEGVHCAACVWLVERTPLVLPGVVECRLDIGRSLATVAWDPERVPLSKIGRFLDAIGYPPHPRRDAGDGAAL